LTNRKKIHNQWDKEAEAKIAHITWCQKCGTTGSYSNPLTKAHRKKRRFIGFRTEEDHQEYLMVARLCSDCHRGYDENWNKEGVENFDPHQIMFDEITKFIEEQ